MTTLPNTLVNTLACCQAHSGKPNFKSLLKPVLGAEMEALRASDDSLYPLLQQGLCYSSSVSDAPIQVCVLSVTDEAEQFIIKAGVFYSGVIAGCSCADDPTPVDEITEYCDLWIELDRQDGGGVSMRLVVDTCHA